MTFVAPRGYMLMVPPIARDDRRTSTVPDLLTIGVEEEYLVVDAETFALRPRAEQILDEGEALEDELQPELSLSQVEIGTPVSSTLDEVRAHLVRLRREVQAAAARTGSAIAATGTHPFSGWVGQPVTPKDRYLDLERDYQQLAREQLISGCHVHVAVPDREMAIAVVDRVRPWLAVLGAIAANSPFWQGVDTGYESYRSLVFSRWPTSGAPSTLGSWAGYERLVGELVRTGSVPDASFLYWDVRPSTRYPTVEFRVGDVCLDVDDAVLLAALARSLTRTCIVAARRGDPAPEPSAELLRAARWRAARNGLRRELVDVVGLTSRPAREVVDDLLLRLRPDLEDHGEWDLVCELLASVGGRGNGARQQREVFERDGDLVAVTRRVVERTTAD